MNIRPMPGHNWPHEDLPGAGRLDEHELDAACWRKRSVILTQQQCAAVDETAGLCGVCGGECATPQACEQPEPFQPPRAVRWFNALRRLVLRPRLALLRWQLDCVRDERERYDELGWASPVYLRNCLQQELELMARIRELETDL